MEDSTVIQPQKLKSTDLSQCGEQQLLELAKKLCAAAAAEHGENGYRGGFRPGNIYAAEDGRVKVGKAAKAGENGWTKLELEFMSPEMFWNGEESAAADVYSIALIMYAGLNGGRLPFMTDNGEESKERAHALRRRMGGDAFPPPADAPEALAQIVMKGLSFEPKDRYENANELLKALWAYCGDEPEELDPHAYSVPEPAKAEHKPAKPEKPEAKKQAAPETEREKPKAPAPDAEKSKAEKPDSGRNMHQRKADRRSAVVLAAIFILLVGAGLARGGIDLDTQQDPVIESSTPTQSDQPISTPEVTPDTTPEPSDAPTEVQYMLYAEDISWDEAARSCSELGGSLAVIKDKTDYERICALLEGTSAQYVWVGAFRENGLIKWVDGQSYDYGVWAAGEPSVTDSYDGAAEDYIMLVRQSDGTWLYNDSRPDPMQQYSRFYSGKMAYICQIG